MSVAVFPCCNGTKKNNVQKQLETIKNVEDIEISDIKDGKSLKDIKYENVILATPAWDHYEQTIKLLDEGKNLYVEKLIKENFDLSPRGIREMLGLNKPIYEKSAAYGHFGREPEADGSFSWEKTDKSSVFNK